MGWLIIDYTAPHARGTFMIFSMLILICYVVLRRIGRAKLGQSCADHLSRHDFQSPHLST
jgi:hypothetical protein